MYNIKDAYECEISDFLMLSYHLREENLSLKHSLKGLDDEVERHVNVSQNETRALVSEVTHLRDAIEQLKLLSEHHKKELELYHLWRKNADQVRLEANLPLHTQSVVEPLYSITMEEYSSMRIRAQRAQEALDIQESNIREVTECLHDFEEVPYRPTLLVSSEEFTAQENGEQEKNNGTLRNRLLKLLDVCKSMHAENAALKALCSTGELEAFRVKRNTAICIREREPVMLRVAEKALCVQDAALKPVDPILITSEPLFVATAEELLEARQCAVEFSERLKLEESKNEALFHQLEEYEPKHTKLLQQLEEALQLLREARHSAESAHQKEMDTAKMLSAKTTEYEDLKSALNVRIFDLESALKLQREEIETFRLKRFEAHKIRQMDGKFRCEYSIDELNTDMSVPVQVSTLKFEPLFCATLEELNTLRDANKDMVGKLERMSSSIRDEFRSAIHIQDADKEAMLNLEELLQELADTRKNYEETRLSLTERETELEQLRTLFKAEGKSGKRELIEAKNEIERLQQDLSVISRIIEDTVHIPDLTEKVNTESRLNPEGVIEALAVSHETECRKVAQLGANRNQLPYYEGALSSYSQRNGIFEKIQRHINRMITERFQKVAELETVYRDLEQLRGELGAAKKKIDISERRTKTLETDLDAVGQRTADLVNELMKRTGQYNQIIKDLHDFEAKRSFEDEKKLIQRLVASERELFEHQEIYKDEAQKYEKQISVLQDQVNCLQRQMEHEGIVNDELCKEVSRLQGELIVAREDVLKKLEEIDILKQEMKSMANMHKEDIDKLAEELEKKNKEVSDVLGKLEELAEMLQAAREGEKSAMQLCTESDAEVFRLQREIDILMTAQSATSISSLTNKDGRMAQATAKTKRSLGRK